MKIISYSHARANLRSTLDEVVESGIPACIVSRNNQVVLMSKSKYDEMVNKLNELEDKSNDK